MKVLFIFYEKAFVNIREEPLAPLVLSALLKDKGHQVNAETFAEEQYNRVFQTIEGFCPDIISVSTTFGVHYRYLPLLKEIKNKYPDLLVVVGGAAPTFNPEIVELPGIDIICRGEGEYPFLELLDALEKKKPYHEIKNLWVKKEGNIYKNGIRPFLTEEELEALPFPDRSLFDCFPYLKKMGIKSVMAGRGCPFNCTYCYNHELKKMAPGKYVRFRSPQRVIEEIEYLIKTEEKVDYIAFQDDIFVLNKDWLKEFAHLYKARIGLPYKCNVFISCVDEEVCEYLKMSHCREAIFGLENGNEKLRKNILNKKVSNKTIEKNGLLLRKYGFQVVTQNIIGIPKETNASVCDTMDLNKKIKVFLANMYFFVPFRGTWLGKYAAQNGYRLKNPELPFDFQDRTALIYPYGENFTELRGLLYLGIDYPFFNKLIRFAYTGHYTTSKKILRKLLWKVYGFLYSFPFIDKIKHSCRPDKVKKKLEFYNP